MVVRVGVEAREQGVCSVRGCNAGVLLVAEQRMIQVVELERFAISVILAEAFEAHNARSLSVTALFGHFHGWRT